MEVDTLITVILAVLGGFSGIYLRLNRLEERLTAHISAKNGGGNGKS